MLVVGLNQTIDRTIRLGALVPGQVLRADEVAITPGGKAVNVCRAALTLGAPARLVGPFPGRLGRVAADLLDAEGLDVVAVPTSGELRGTTVVIEGDGRTTVINEPGPPLGDAEWHDVLAAVSGALVDRAPSSPSAEAFRRASPPASIAPLIELVHARGGRVAVDVTGDSAARGGGGGRRSRQPQPRRSRAGPREATAAAGHGGGEAVDLDDLARADVVERCRAAAAALVATGARAAMVSAGRHGVACHGRRASTRSCRLPTVDVVNPIGAGDALLGATLVALERGRTLRAGRRRRGRLRRRLGRPPGRRIRRSDARRRALRRVAGRRRRGCDPSTEPRPSGADGHRRRRSRRRLAEDGVTGAQQRGQRAPGQGRPGSAGPPPSSASGPTSSPACCAPGARRRWSASSRRASATPSGRGVLQGVEAVIGGGDRFILSASTRDRSDHEPEIVSAMVERRVMALLVVPTTVDQTYLAAIAAAGTPVVCIDRPAVGADVDAVVADDVGGVRRGMEPAGRPRPSPHRLPRHGVDLHDGASGSSGYRHALAAAGIAADDAARPRRHQRRRARRAGGRRPARARRAADRRVPANVSTSIGLLVALRQRRWSPAIVAFSDFDAARIARSRRSPSSTTTRSSSVAAAPSWRSSASTATAARLASCASTRRSSSARATWWARDGGQPAAASHCRRTCSITSTAAASASPRCADATSADPPISRPEEWLASTVARWGTDGSGSPTSDGGTLHDLVAADPETLARQPTTSPAGERRRRCSSSCSTPASACRSTSTPTAASPPRTSTARSARREAWVVIDAPAGGGTVFVGDDAPGAPRRVGRARRRPGGRRRCSTCSTR